MNHDKPPEPEDGSKPPRLQDQVLENGDVITTCVSCEERVTIKPMLLFGGKQILICPKCGGFA